MVLFVFVVMMLNLGGHAVEMERQWLTPGIWIGPVLLAAIRIIEVFYLVRSSPGLGTGALGPKEDGISLYGPYLIGVELASMLLLAGLVGAYHLGFHQAEKLEKREIQHGADTHERRVAAGGDLVLAGTDKPSRTP